MQILAPRIGYLPLLVTQIKPLFSAALPPGEDTVWFEYKGLPLKWYSPGPWVVNIPLILNIIVIILMTSTSYGSNLLFYAILQLFLDEALPFIKYLVSHYSSIAKSLVKLEDPLLDALYECRIGGNFQKHM